MWLQNGFGGSSTIHWSSDVGTGDAIGSKMRFLVIKRTQVLDP
jgi:hypothetical protein